MNPPPVPGESPLKRTGAEPPTRFSGFFGLSAADFNRRRTGWDHALALLVGLLAFALYLRTVAPGLLGSDSGEFQFAAWLGGFAHPTGYPLYLMLGWLWTHLAPWHDPAWRMNAFSALWAGVAVGLVYLLSVRILRAVQPADRAAHQPAMRLTALFAALTFAVTPTFWSQAVIAEVYTLHAAFVSAVLLAVLIWAERRSWRWLYLAALTYGLSLTHHRTMILLAPALVVFVWLIARSRFETTPAATPAVRTTGSRLAPRRLVTLALCLLAPLLLYAYIPLRAPHVPYFSVTVGAEQVLPLYRPTLAGFLEHISGSGFGSAIGGGPRLAAALVDAGRRFAGEVTWAGIALGLLGLGWLAWRSRPLLALTGLSFAAIVGFNLFYGIGDIYVFYIPAYLIWALWMGAGVWACGRAGVWWQNRGAEERRSGGAGRRRLVSLFPCLLALLLPVHLLTAHFLDLDRSRDDTARTAWAGILAQPIPSDAILVTNDRDEMTPQWYLKYVEGVRADLTGLFPLIQPGPAWRDVAAVTDQALRSGRPVYLVKPMPGLEVRFRLEGQGTDGKLGELVRVLGPAAEGPPEHPAAAVYGDRVRLIGYDLLPSAPTPGALLTVRLYWQPLGPLPADYTTFVHLVNADGAKIGQSDHRPGGVYYPSSLWKPGETLVDAHTLTVAADMGRGPYTIVVGMYDAAAGMRGLGEPAEIGGW